MASCPHKGCHGQEGPAWFRGQTLKGGFGSLLLIREERTGQAPGRSHPPKPRDMSAMCAPSTGLPLPQQMHLDSRLGALSGEVGKCSRGAVLSVNPSSTTGQICGLSKAPFTPQRLHLLILKWGSALGFTPRRPGEKRV